MIYNYSKVVNGSGLIQNWNVSGWIANWNATGYIANWNASGLIANASIIAWNKIDNGSVVLNGTSGNYYVGSSNNFTVNSALNLTITSGVLYASVGYAGMIMRNATGVWICSQAGVWKFLG